jgi:hypothetical protein
VRVLTFLFVFLPLCHTFNFLNQLIILYVTWLDHYAIGGLRSSARVIRTWVICKLLKRRQQSTNVFPILNDTIR